MQYLVNFPYVKFSIIILITSVSNLFSFNSFSQTISTHEIDSIHEEVRAMLVKNNSDSAIELASFTLEKSIELNYDLGKAHALTLSAWFYLNKTQLDTSGILLNKANEIYIANNIFKDSIKSQYGHLLLGLGKWHVFKRNFEKAEINLTKAKSLFEKTEDEKRLNTALTLLGIMHGKQGDYANALEYFLLAYKAFSKINDETNASTLLGNIAICYKNMGHFEKSIKYMKDGLKLDLKNNRRSQVFKFNNLGTIYSELEQVDSAIYYGHKAYVASRKFGLFNSGVIALSNLAQRYIKKEQYSIAEKLMEEALKLADSVGINDMSERFDLVKAGLFFDKNNYDSTLFYARRAFHSTSRFSNKRYSRDLAHRLSFTFEKMGKYDSALHYFNVYFKYKDSLFNKKNQQKFTELYAKMDNLEKQNKIELLNEEKKLESLKKQRLLIASVAITLIAVLLTTMLIYRHKNRLKRQELKQTRLEAEIEKGQQDLYKQTLHMIHVNNTLDSLEGKVKEAMSYNPDTKYSDILQTIKLNKSLEKDWENFNNYFSNTHSDFYKSLSSNEIQLSNHEKRVCALIKLNLSNREIATILNIESKSVTMLKYRLKKKIGLTEQVDLGSYIQQL